MFRSARRIGAPAVVPHTLIDGYKLVNVGGHFHLSHPHTFLSPHLIGSITLQALLFTRGKLQQGENSVFGLGFLLQHWPALTMVNAWSNWPETLPIFRFSQSTFFGTIPEAGRWLWLGCVDLATTVVCIDRWLTALTFGVDCFGCPRGLCDTSGWLTVLRLCWLKHHGDHRNAPTHLYILACLLSICWYVLSAFYFLVYVIADWYWDKK